MQRIWQISTNNEFIIIVNNILIYFSVPQRYYHNYSNAHEQLSHFHTTLLLLHKAGFTLILEMYNFFNEEMDYLGHIIRPCKLELADHSNEVIR